MVRIEKSIEKLIQPIGPLFTYGEIFLLGTVASNDHRILKKFAIKGTVEVFRNRTLKSAY